MGAIKRMAEEAGYFEMSSKEQEKYAKKFNDNINHCSISGIISNNNKNNGNKDYN